MIVVTIRGGLGNQMFQYAFGRAMATVLDRRLALDLTMLPTGAPTFLRTFELPALGIASGTLLIGDAGRQRAALVRRRPLVRGLGIAARLTAAPWRVNEPDQDILVAPDELPSRLAVCVGFWQSHLYFRAIADEMRSELTPKVEPSGPVAKILRRIEGRPTIAVHVRRGDYVEVPQYQKVHGSQPASFYRAAVDRISRQCDGRPLAVVLSDDPGWVSKNLSLDIETEHVELHRGLSTPESLSLMSRCRHHVISNSSFSWWGAWLAQHPGQQVIYPQRWFVDRRIDRSFRVPHHWRTLEST